MTTICSCLLTNRNLKNGAKKVILTVPSKDAIDRIIVLGVNDNEWGYSSRVVDLVEKFNL